MLPCYVVLDLETTGGNPLHSRVTEIAAVRVEGGVEVARWSSLVNPGLAIPYFIQQLTGITDAMVQTAPRFEQVGPQLLQLLDGAVLIAHNVRFDHSFLLHEFERMGVALRVKTLCTVRLSRKLYPQHRGHGLDALMQRHGLSTMARHRAMGDVDVVQSWLRVATAELGADRVRSQALGLLQGSAVIPPHLETEIARIPNTVGVYLLYGEGPLALYVGKSVTLRTRILSHFQAASTQAREMRIAQEVRRIEWRETAGELGALLLEARLVKELQPVFNRQLRRERGLCAWRLDADPQAKPLVNLVSGDALMPHEFDHLYGVYRSKAQAVKALRELASAHQLCPQSLGLESGKGRCFAQQLGHCKGVCCQQERPELHYLRVQSALLAHRLQRWPYHGKIGVREHNSSNDRSDLHIFDQWCHLGTVQDDAQLEQHQTDTSVLAFDIDTYRMLTKYLANPHLVRSGQLHMVKLHA